MRKPTLKQAAMRDLLLLHGPLTRVQCERGVAGMDHPDLPAKLVEQLPQSEGSARDILEALVRRGEATRLPGSPARYALERPSGYGPSSEQLFLVEARE